MTPDSRTTRSPAARLGACAPLELAQQREAALGTAARAAREKARLGVDLGERSGREFFDQLVDAHVARLGERLEPLLRRVGHAVGRVPTGSLLHKFCGGRDAKVRKAQL